MKKVVVIGAGHGGVQVAASLRDEGFEGEIVLISEEKELPYQKPPLSKGFLQGKQTEVSILFRSEQYYVSNAIDLRLGVTIASINPKENYISTVNGEKIDFTYLILATGAANRKLRFDGKEPKNVYYLRTLSDAKWIGQQLESANNVVIVGGGFIGLELAALAVEKGKKVTVIEAQSRLMERVLPEVISKVFYETHIQKGAKVYLGACVNGIQDNGDVVLSTGEALPSDLILAGIGVIPETQLAKEAGIICENGIVVNELQQTSIPNIYAIGDVANHYNPFAKKNLRLESVQNAVDQAKTAAAHILGKAVPYNAVPWFWTFQYHLKLQMAGISLGYDDYVVRGDTASGKFSIYYYKEGKLIGVDSLNKPADHLNARKLLELGIHPAKEEIRDLSLSLKELVSVS
ncbi:NAD(P)/FAD-dependent oxidoreductase [Maribacter sp. 4G9]|uniref:NAD(P)/FAD-dependent oxidoreductase n=1 Tax=Maribacter sp. 4G9 TaxID=1889777 RepID=UPI000C14D229|nr:FAD-dependent oxidoreductase [Maribacter sp. 4G9]PIB27570.1 ferredoxin-NAD reductase [Maribacter sp. 4G9]